MANINGVSIIKGKQGANVLGGADSVSGLIVGALAPTNIAYNVAKAVYNMKDVETLGITEAYDLASKVNFHRHLKEFYRSAGEGTELYIMVVEPTLTMSAICKENAKKY